MTPVVGTRMLAHACLCALAACGGPAVQFDAKPAPGWLYDKPAQIGAQNLTAVGIAPATLNASRDQELSLAIAKASIAQLFESQVKSSASDWSVAVTDAGDDEQAVTSQSIEVRSNVTVEDVTIKETYRDEATRSHYVRIEVNRAAWTKRLSQRLTTGLEELTATAERADSELHKQRPLAALSQVLKGLHQGRQIEPDIVVIDLLAQELGMRARLLAQKQRLEATSQALRSMYAVALVVKGPTEAVRRFARNAQQFLNVQGFSVTDQVTPDVIRIEAAIGQALLQQETVGERLEYVHAARGTLKVKDADGSELPALAIDLGSDRYTERDVVAKNAITNAESLAADTLAALFRSAYRKAFVAD